MTTVATAVGEGFYFSEPFCADMADDFVTSFGAHRVQTHGQSFILLVGKEVDFGAEELSNQGAGVIEAFDLVAGKLGEGCFSPISDELDRVDEVFFL